MSVNLFLIGRPTEPGRRGQGDEVPGGEGRRGEFQAGIRIHRG